MTGTRKDNLDGHLPNPGQYGRDRHGDWFGMSPNGHLANLSAHQVTEHGDGTITVHPSILIQDGERRELWHGWLQGGVWR